MKEQIQDLLKQASQVEQAVILEILQRGEVGKKKYGTTMDRQDLSLAQWLEHAQQETQDLALYLKKSQIELARRNTQNATEIDPEMLPAQILNFLQIFRNDYQDLCRVVRTIYEGDTVLAKMVSNILDNLESEEHGLPQRTPLSQMLLQVFRMHDGKDVRAGMREAFDTEPLLARFLASVLANWEADKMSKEAKGGKPIAADAMLKIIGEIPESKKLDLLKYGLEAGGTKIKFVNVTPKDKNSKAKK